MTASGKWGLRGVCPHGVEVVLFFDSLGYVTKPGPQACDKLHGPPVLEEVKVTRKERRAALRALKRFRRQLEDL